MRTGTLLNIILGVVVILVAVFGMGWWVMSAPKMANSSLAINLRQNYYTTLGPKLGVSLQSLPYEIAPTLEVQGEPGYVYTMLGKFASVDKDNKIVYLQTKSGDVYGFSYATGPADELIYREKRGDSFEDVNFGDTPLGTEDALLIQWSDTRKLEEIVAGAKADEVHKLVNPNMGERDLLLVIKMK